MFGSRIERNRIIGFVQPCAQATPRNLPAAIWLGLRVTDVQAPAITPIVRFDDIQGNAHAGLRVAPNQASPADVSSVRGHGRVGQGRGTPKRNETDNIVFVTFL